jgi:apolipoprotein N-acyltransferase
MSARSQYLSSGIATLLLGVGGGTLLALAFPPTDVKPLAWVGLVPVLLAIRRTRCPGTAAAVGFVAGIAFALIVIRPLVTSHDWTGWAAVSRQELLVMRDRQWWFLNLMWLVVSAVGGGVAWAAFAAALKLLWRNQPWSLVTVAPALWIFQEWGRVQILWGFHWAVLGSAAADLPAVRQLAALGGSWALGAVFVFANCGLFLLLFVGRERRRLASAAVCGLIVAVVWIGGAFRLHGFSEPLPGLRAGVIQHHQASYRFEDFTVTGLSRQYIDVMEQVFAKMGDSLDLLVLPESVSFGSVSLDGTLNPDVDEAVQVEVNTWEVLIGSLIGSHRTLVVIGSETSSDGRQHNSQLFFTADGLAGVYHKQNLVPFAERVPPMAAAIGVGGSSSFTPGTDSAIVTARGMALGGFICQEVLYPGTIRRSVLSGATILVSGGNDGVFASPAVAQVHADLAQLRAVEAGRYVARAMKTGISAIIDPTGRERQRSGTEPVFLWAAVEPRSGLTPYARFGDWPVLLVSLLLVALGIAARRRARAGAAGEVPPTKSMSKTPRKRAERSS